MIEIHNLQNGLAVVLEQIPTAQSAAYDLLIPGGIILDEPGHEGACLVLAELTSRGAGGMDSKSLSEAFDERGIRHSESAGHDRFVYRGSMLSGELERALSLVSAMVKDPSLPDDELESIRSVLIQDLRSLADNPARRVMVELTKRYYPDPYGRSSLGTEEGINGSHSAFLQESWKKRFRPSGSVLSIAGKIDPAATLKMVERYFGGWEGQAMALPTFGRMPGHSEQHIEFESAQMQIAFAYPSAKFGERHYYTAKVAAGILSGGMFGRLFIEVREKRGLCYSVFARHSATKDFGTMLAYAGTTPERAHETLDVMKRELKSLAGTITSEEIARAKANLKSSLVIGEESTGARAGSNASEWWIDRKIRSLDEIVERVNGVKTEEIEELLVEYPSDSYMLQTLGSKKNAAVAPVEAAI